MFFVEDERDGGHLFKSFDIVNKRDKSRIKARPQYPLNLNLGKAKKMKITASMLVCNKIHLWFLTFIVCWLAMGATTVGAQPQLDQSNVGAETAATAIGSEFAAQVITAGKSGILASVDFAIRKFDGFTFGDITLQIRGVTSGVPNSTILGSKTFANSSIAPLPAEFTTFDLSSLNLFLHAGDAFSVVVVSANQSGSLFPIALTDNLYAGGDFFASIDGTNWFSFGRDTRFRTFVVNTFIVTNTNDSGAGSLREAITAANGDGVATTITFDPLVFPPPPGLPGVIAPLTALPNLTGPGDTIDGTGAGVVLDGINFAAANQIAGLRVRASNVTVQGLTFQNFSGNDAVVVEGRDNRPVVTGVIITGNTFNNNFRAVRVDGGNQTVNTTVDASVVGNTLSDNFRGITVLGNVGDGDGGNTVSAFIDSNSIKGAQIEPFVGGDGIAIGGASGIGSGNSVTATVSNNTLNDIPDDGVAVFGCGNNATGSNNTVNAVVSGNVIRYKNDNSPANFLNQGIVVTGAAGESDALSFCSGNSIVFEISNNTVDGFKNNNITVSGGDEGTTNNDVQGIIVGNTATNSRGNPGSTTNRGGTGINVSGGTGVGHFVHDITVSGNTVRGNPLRGIIVSGGGSGSDSSNVTRITVSSNTVDGKPPQSPSYSIIPETDQDGILITGGANAVNADLSDILVDGNIAKNNQRGGIRVTQGDASNDVSLSGIMNNIATENAEDGISIRAGVPGLGATPVSGNQCNKNGEDGIDINSPGYSLSNNSCSRNVAGDGINAVVGNTNGGGNSGQRNGACNQPNFCFNTP
jgi:hypothetical protein